MKRRRSPHMPHYNARYLAVSIAFLAFCAVFAARLIFYQVAMRDVYARASTSAATRTITVEGTRGRICDRNGMVLVENSYTYDLEIDYDGLPNTRAEMYTAFLGVLDTIEAAADTDSLAEWYFPFDGSYPDYTYSAAALDTDSAVYAALCRVINADTGLVSDDKYSSAEQVLGVYSARMLAEYFAEKYEIIKFRDKDSGYVSEYSDRDTDRLIRMRYGMLATGFGVYSNFKVVKNADAVLQAMVKERHLSGVVFTQISERSYKYPGTATHILGYIGLMDAEEYSDIYRAKGYPYNATVGKTGVELAFEDLLHGTDGELGIVEDSEGNVVSTFWIKEPVPGHDIWLTIDIDVQLEAEAALYDNIMEIREIPEVNGEEYADCGAVTAIDPDTGEVLALASYPTYSLETFRSQYEEIAASGALRNNALSAYAPGSTFKVGMALAFLETGTVGGPTDSILTHGIYERQACSHLTYVNGAPTCCGTINISQALECSCNYYFARYGDLLGLTSIQDYCKLYGLGEHTGIELYEDSGAVSNVLPYATAIGQGGNLFTPLQLSQYISMIANGEKRYSAHLLYRDVDTINDSFVQTEPKELGALTASASNLDAVRHGMWLVINGGLSSNGYVRAGFANCDYEAAGKTGTAEKNGEHDSAWFTAFAPYDDPEIVVTCYIHQGITGGYTSSTVARTIAAYLSSQEKIAG